MSKLELIEMIATRVFDVIVVGADEMCPLEAIAHIASSKDTFNHKVEEHWRRNVLLIWTKKP
jgi:hypothetical protein